MRRKKPDNKNAQSILTAAHKKMQFTLTLPVSEDSASTIVSNIYECFRMLGDALYVQMGIMTTNHWEVIDNLIELDVVTKRPIAVIKNLRQLRHNINYYGYEPPLAEVEDAIDIAHTCFSALYEEVQRQLA